MLSPERFFICSRLFFLRFRRYQLVAVRTLTDAMALIAAWEAVLHDHKLWLSLLAQHLADRPTHRLVCIFSKTMHG